MPHKRQLIGLAVVAQLVGEAPGYATPAQARVLLTREAPWRPKDLPAIAVYATDETVDPGWSQTSPRTLQRHLEMTVEYAVRVAPERPTSTAPTQDETDAALNEGAAAIEAALHADDTLAATAIDCVLLRTALFTVVAGDQPIGVAQLVYDVVYATDAPDLTGQALDQFLRLDAKYNLGNAQLEADEPEDLVTVSEEES